MGAFYVLMHATPVLSFFLLLSVHYLCNLIQAISGLLLHVIMICKGESPSGSFLRSMGKLGLDWIGVLNYNPSPSTLLCFIILIGYR